MPKKIDPQVKARAVRLVTEHRGEYPSLTAACEAVARQTGLSVETVRRSVRQAQVDSGDRPGTTSEESEEIKRNGPPTGCPMSHQSLLKSHHLVGSMGRSYGAGDNASMESFFSLLQKNVLDTRRWDTREDLRLAIVTWIETKYNRRRRQRRLGRLTTVEFETIYAAAQAA